MVESLLFGYHFLLLLLFADQIALHVANRHDRCPRDGGRLRRGRDVREGGGHPVGRRLNCQRDPRGPRNCCQVWKVLKLLQLL